MNINVMLTAAPEFLNVLSRLADKFSGSSEVSAPSVTEKAAPRKSKTEATAAVAADIPAPITKTAEGENKTISVEDIRLAVKAKSDAGHKAAVLAVLTEYGVKTVSSIPADKYGEFMEKINDI